MFKKREYKFSDNVQSSQGILSMIIGILLIIILIVCIGTSIVLKGNLGIIVGCIGNICIIVSLIGMGIAIESYKDEHTLSLFKNIGLSINFIAGALWAAIFAFGYLKG